MLGSIGWGRTNYQAATTDLSGLSRQATQWIIDHTAKDDVIVVKDYVWPDLARHGNTSGLVTGAVRARFGLDPATVWRALQAANVDDAAAKRAPLER